MPLLPDSYLKAVIDAHRKHVAQSSFAKDLKGKSLVLVGPDPVLVGQKRGKWIDDSHDRVMRLNTVFDYLPHTPTHARDMGNRTDILYWSPDCMKKYTQAGQRTWNKLQQTKIKWVAYQNGNDFWKRQKSGQDLSLGGAYMKGQAYCFAKELQLLTTHKRPPLQLNFSDASATLVSDILSAMASSPASQRSVVTRTGLPASQRSVVTRTGFIPIMDALICGAKSIDVIGMSFYHGGGHLHRPDVKKSLDPLSNHLGKSSPHDSWLEIQLFQQLCRLYPQVIKPSPELQAIMKKIHTL